MSMALVLWDGLAAPGRYEKAGAALHPELKNDSILSIFKGCRNNTALRC